jgi:hypothetical protein
MRIVAAGGGFKQVLVDTGIGTLLVDRAEDADEPRANIARKITAITASRSSTKSARVTLGRRSAFNGLSGRGPRSYSGLGLRTRYPGRPR